MQELTGTNLTNRLASIADIARDAVEHPDFRSGMEGGIEAFESECDEREHFLSARETGKIFAEELSPIAIARDKAYEYACNYTPTSVELRAGFIAGWALAHLIGVVGAAFYDSDLPGVILPFRARVAATPPETQPLAVVGQVEN